MGIVSLLRGRTSRPDRTSWPVRRYLVLIGATALVALLAGCWYGFTWESGHARTAELTELNYQATRAAESVTASIALGEETVQSVAAQPGLDAVFKTIPNACTLSAAGDGAFPSVRLDIVAADGQVGCSSDKAAAVFATRVHQGSSWLSTAMASTTTTVVWDASDAVTGEPTVVVTARVLASDGRPAGVVALFLHVRGSAAGLAHDYAGSDRASFTLIDQATRVAVSTSLVSAQAVGALGRPIQALPGNGEGKALDGSSQLFASRPVAGSSWRVYVGIPTAYVLAAARGGLLRGGLIGVLALLLLAVALLILNRRVAGPLRDLTAAVVAAGRDAEGTRARPRGAAELVTLAAEVNVMLDVREGHEAQLVHQATHDSLTGLPNASLLRDRLEQALRRDRREARIAVLTLGIDRFRTLNDALGPDAADRVLVELAERLAGAVRPGDTLARIGGDRFVVLCEDIDDAEQAARVAERLLACSEQPFHPSTDAVEVSCSVGVSLATGHDHTPSAPQLLREADSALHEAKSTGSPWILSDQHQQSRASAYLDTERQLRAAVQGGELCVYYQPVLDIATGRLAGAEALVRWEHPVRGLVPPMEFIPLAEETGQIGAIGTFVLRAACIEAASWAAAGHELSVSVNVAVGQLRDPEFASSVHDALEAAGLPPGRLCLEVTESAMMRAAGSEVQVLEDIRRLGVKLAIDDFGTGYSSLAYLHQLPVDQLKIDRSFVNRITPGSRDAHLVQAIVGMAHALGLQIVAEGVETAAQLEFLAALDCEQAQGYLFSRPVPGPEFRDRLVGSAAEPVAREPAGQSRQHP